MSIYDVTALKRYSICIFVGLGVQAGKPDEDFIREIGMIEGC